MKKLKILLIVLSVLVSVTGCSKGKVLKSVEFLNDLTYYKIYINFTKDNVTHSLSYIFDDNSGIREKIVIIDNIPTSNEMIKINDSSITRFYGDYAQNPNWNNNSYYLKSWHKENLEINEQNINTYDYLDKSFYIDMISNGLKYKNKRDHYEILVSKKYIQKIINQLVNNQITLIDDVNISVTLDNNKNLNSIQLKDNTNNLIIINIRFQTKFKENEDSYLEFPETGIN